MDSHAAAFYLWSAFREIRKGKWSNWRLVLVLGVSILSLPNVLEYVQAWREDDFAPVGEFGIHRVDHFAHIGGIVTGFLNAYLQLG